MAGSARSAVFEVPIIDLAHTVCDDEDCFDLKVDLDKPGRYVWYCPVGDHRERGMKGTITVKG